MSKRTSGGSAAERIAIADEELLEELDELVAEASRGNRRAVGAIAIAFGPMLNEEARGALGPQYEQDSADVLQELFLGMCEGSLVFPAIRGAAIPWMRRMVRETARKWVRERELPEGAAE